MASAYWERKRADDLDRAARHPDKTDLYRIVHHSYERLELEWESRFRTYFGYLRREVPKAFERYLTCGVPDFGFARIECLTPGCSEQKIIAFSCKTRCICPRCSAKRAVHFAEHLHENVLGNVPLRHMVFSVPKILRHVFRRNRKNNNIILRAGWETIQHMLQQIFPEGRAAAVSVVQSAGEDLEHNPHNHSLVADGVYGADGTFYELGYYNQERFTEYFAHRVLTLLVRKKLISAEIAENILSWEHSGFSVWIGDQIRPEDADSRRFIARYICRSPISLQKLCIQQDTITIHTENKGHAQFEDGSEFLARLQMHLPSRYESLIRRYGQWSYRICNRNSPCGDDKLAIMPLSEQISKKQLSRSWALLINKIYEIDPLRCTRCNGDMAIKQFFCGQVQTKPMLAIFGIAPFRAPPPLRSPPTAGEHIDEVIDHENFNQEHWAE